MKKLLNIDGGGVRVYISLLILDYIEIKTGKKIVDIFDYFSGVSASSIILAGLLTRYSVKEILVLFKDITSKIFYRSFAHMIISGFGILDSKYTDYYINIELEKLFENNMISTCKKPFSILTYDMVSSKPVTFYSYKDTELKLWEIVRGSSAAPTYFSPYKIHEYNLIDGGVVANNLSELTFIDAVEYFGKEEDYIQVSIGTGTYNETVKTYPSGIWSWSSSIVDVFFSANSNKEMMTLDKISKFENLKHFHRLDIILNNIIRLDDSTSFDMMDIIVKEWLETNTEYLNTVCEDLLK